MTAHCQLKPIIIWHSSNMEGHISDPSRYHQELVRHLHILSKNQNLCDVKVVINNRELAAQKACCNVAAASLFLLSLLKSDTRLAPDNNLGNISQATQLLTDNMLHKQLLYFSHHFEWAFDFTMFSSCLYVKFLCLLFHFHSSVSPSALCRKAYSFAAWKKKKNSRKKFLNTNWTSLVQVWNSSPTNCKFCFSVWIWCHSYNGSPPPSPHTSRKAFLGWP